MLAASTLLTASNAGLMGISRLAFNLSRHQQLPEVLGRVHSHFRTPYIAIVMFCLIALGVLTPAFFIPNFFADLGVLYAFGSLLCFGLAHASLLGLWMKHPDLPRPFKLGAEVLIPCGGEGVADGGGGGYNDSLSGASLGNRYWDDED